MSYEEISEALSIPLGTVGSRKNLAIASLRRSLAGWED
jgi:DNA-directed RNA polymerase specialized sigma24 family protein